MRQIVGGLPIVEGLIAILDGCEERRDQTGSEEKGEGLDGFNSVDARASVVRSDTSAGQLYRKITQLLGESVGDGPRGAYFFFACPPSG